MAGVSAKKTAKKKTAKKKVVKKIGRPKGSSTFTLEIGDEICELLAEGMSAVRACKKLGVAMRTFYRWQREMPEFLAQVTRAREDQADTFADQMCDIAEFDEDVQRAKLKIDARKWVAARMKPKSWGDKQDLNVGVQQSLSDVMREIGAKSALDIARERSGRK